MSQHYPYALYLDNKVKGAIKQLIQFYSNGVFARNNTIVYLKKYPTTQRFYSRALKKACIPFAFMRSTQLDALENQIIFYAFNAQSNCRLVANRKLKHVFITHGESNKISSVKPIIRIYDHVAMAGPLSLERYYKSGLFTEHDYHTRRLLLTGDTFVGALGFQAQGTHPIVLYAPTWEGGITSENYSSLGYPVVKQALLQTLKKRNINSLLIKPHPNLGHRDKSYQKKLQHLALCLNKEGVKVYLYQELLKNPLVRYRLNKAGIQVVNTLEPFKLLHALVDISAMEAQCINEKIPYHIFYLPQLLRKDLPNYYQQIYRTQGINLSQPQAKLHFDQIDTNSLRNDVFKYDTDVLTNPIDLTKRISQIHDFVTSTSLSNLAQ